MIQSLCAGFLTLVWIRTATCLDNGLALTPPMGFMSWQRYRCITDCKLYPNECISEKLFRNVTDLMVSEGYADAGYKYVIIDDCWLANTRDKDGKLQPDPLRFPSGIKALADYVHSRGLLFGIYEDIGTNTCAGYPGSADHFELDAQTFADWGVDYVKLDGCYTKNMVLEKVYPEFGQALKKTGRPMVYSCSWPAYKIDNPDINWTAIAEHCNLWRLYGDIDDSWGSVWSIMSYFAKRSDLVQHAGPGHWNDPDMLIIGNFGLTVWQSEAQMAVWAVLAAPLLLSTDLAKVQPEFKQILQNKRVIAINQDPLGIQGKKTISSDDIHVWVRPISPKLDEHYSYAIAFVSSRTDGWPYPFKTNLSDLGLHNPSGYIVQDLFRTSYQEELLKPESKISIRIVPTGVVFLEFRAISGEEAKAKAAEQTEKTGGASSTTHSLEMLFITVLLLVLQFTF
ncbi:alpha-N-acetylgalactosaminidase-like [Macrosteles quadrilineatus]|uniref:alpha-N-acetylgalactosaminidase-like n=1 Tax=Macrosteles quadrilineatus TaxID=74068 RepID=UPI0023E291D6|nr:alpha-N-acetylgalactosaminidase-like [Macrosteles quadrilineatus]XP_054289420.1 alpha-N-acetylgalactosaminidase-like [Macrosteles quadrilineatus]